MLGKCSVGPAKRDAIKKDKDNVLIIATQEILQTKSILNSLTFVINLKVETIKKFRQIVKLL